jgi:RHS repeat-associated protein
LAGQYLDVETGLHYNWNRYYDPALGRYLRVDPLGDGLNLYAYCFNNPNRLIDPRGLCSSSGGLAGLHNALALAGLIPGVGFLPDLADAFVYLLEGDMAGLTVSGLAAIPLIGQWARVAWMANKAAKLTDAYNVAKKASKRGPKPFGTGPHNNKIKEVADSVKNGEVIAGGQTGLPEVGIKTPGGVKQSRRPDILVQRPDGSQYGINVGKTTKNGAPIKREAEAINDLEGAGLEMHYVPYD